jgi:DNA mismatch repair protein MutL
MPNIQVLDSHVADLISAGEVVERPASAVKELMENAIDAGARNLTVEIQRGGMAFIRVTDDGCGIPPEEVETAFLRHATSKIHTEYDLEAIGTLGFRGEALAAISAVSRMEVITRVKDAQLGVSLMLEGGMVKSREQAGGPQGTTMIVRDLFYNTPARLKYMKKDSAEGAAVFAAVQREALARPDVSVTFIRDGKRELATPGDKQLRTAVYSVLGRDLALGFLPVTGSGEDDITVTGFASLPACCRGSRSCQYFFVNGRFIKSRTMTAALEEAYRNQKMVGKFPGCVLHVTTRPGAVDVNVHPAKTEVKFVSEKRIFSSVYHSVLSALDHAATPRVPERPTSVTGRAAACAMTAEEFRAAPLKTPVSPAPSAAAYLGSYLRRDPERTGTLSLNDVTRPTKPVVFGIAPERLAPAQPSPVEKSFAAIQKTECTRPAPVPEKTEFPVTSPEMRPTPWRMAGELFSTYIVVEQGDRVLLIDKHAAHERMNFDRLKAAGYTPMPQQLLVPLVFTPAAEEGQALLENLPLLARLGFDAGDFGGGAIAVRRAPDYVDAAGVEETLTELAAALLNQTRADPDSVRDAVLATMACKAAIKGGQKNGPEELERVARAVMDGQVRYCPHGRPVSVELTRKELEKWFHRT